MLSHSYVLRLSVNTCYALSVAPCGRLSQQPASVLVTCQEKLFLSSISNKSFNMQLNCLEFEIMLSSLVNMFCLCVCVCLHRYKLVELAFYLTMGFFPASVIASMVIFWRISIIYSRIQFICTSRNTSSTRQGGGAMSVLLPLLAEVVYQKNDCYFSSVLLMNTSQSV